MRIFAWGAVSGLIGVAAGAFGAHALRGRLDPALLQVFETGARYHLFHALALLATGLAHHAAPRRGFVWAGALFALGTVTFSGSLYALALTAVRAWGAVTPFGGLLLLVGWLVAAWTAFQAGASGAPRRENELHP